jgi:TRAP-type C4-dicarboxylate transport system permease large subunit
MTGHPPASPRRLWLSTLPVLLILLSYLFTLGTLEQVRSRLLAFGTRLAPGYTDLRTYPTCEPCAEAKAAAPAQEAKPAAAAEDDPFAEPTGAPSAAAEEAAHQACLSTFAKCQSLLGQLTPQVKAYRTVETSLSHIVELANGKRLYFLILLLLIGAGSATALRSHIGLRPVRTVLDDRFSEGLQLAAHVLLFGSWWAQYKLDHEALPLIWMGGMLVMSAFNIAHLLKPDPSLEPGGNLLTAPLTAPLYAGMGILAGLFFFIVEKYPSGLATYLQPLTEHSVLYFQVGLYGWAGMLLVRTRVLGLFFDMLRPWRLPTELLVFVVVVCCAFPTAYTGASGIFVIASGAAIFEELRRSGARPRLALAGTAMSGSLGVVLPPCLLVMIIAELNKEVTPDQIYGWGWKVFGLSAVLFLAAMLLTRREKLNLAPPGEAASASLKAARPIVPFILVGVAVVAFYALPLGTRLDEHSAPSILPVLLLALLAYDRFAIRRITTELPEHVRREGWGAAVSEATGETAVHIGALLMLMGLSACLGGVVERSHVMDLVPTHFSSPLLAMSVLSVVLVITGMLMDPYGAVILVSNSIDDIALKSGISPTHFWMVVLVAFELGYLLPPVALNQLLARKVIGPIPDDGSGNDPSFWRRHEDVLLPIAVMSMVLVIVAFGPILWPR